MHDYQNLKGIWNINTKVSVVEALHISIFFKESALENSAMKTQSSRYTFWKQGCNVVW
jgi:hypothetical protein